MMIVRRYGLTSRESGRWILTVGTHKRIVRRDIKDLEEMEDKRLKNF